MLKISHYSLFSRGNCYVKAEIELKYKAQILVESANLACTKLALKWGLSPCMILIGTLQNNGDYIFHISSVSDVTAACGYRSQRIK
jgi:hypothetical protein